MFDHGSDHIALEPIASPKIWIGDPGADATPSETAMTRSSVPKIFHASTALRLPQRFRAVAAASGIAVKPTITSPHPALCGNGPRNLANSSAAPPTAITGSPAITPTTGTGVAVEL